MSSSNPASTPLRSSGPLAQFELFHDGDCPLCAREVGLLMRLDRNNKILFTDIAASDFDAQSVGKTQTVLIDSIHGRLPNGKWVTGVEVFRQLYAAVGFGWVVTITRFPPLAKLMDWCYARFAKHRLALTGRRCRPTMGASSCDVNPSRD